MTYRHVVLPLTFCLLACASGGCGESPAQADPNAERDLALLRDMGADEEVVSRDAGGPSRDAAVDGPAQDTGPDVPAASLTIFEGTYFVPERRPVSSYPVEDVRWTRIEDRALLDYQLPRLLDGQGTRVTFAGDIDDGFAMLEGANGTAACQLNAEGLPESCLERFVGLDVDLDRVRREAEDADPGRVEERVEVARQFRNDPIGVLEPGTVVSTRVAVVCRTPAECAPREECDREPSEPLGICERE